MISTKKGFGSDLDIILQKQDRSDSKNPLSDHLWVRGKIFKNCTARNVVAARLTSLFETIISGEMRVTPTQWSHFWDIWRQWAENTSQLISFYLTTTSIITEIWSLKNFDSLLHRPKCWLRLLLEPKILTPAPAPAQNANSGRSPLRRSRYVIISTINESVCCFEWFLTWFTGLRENKWNRTLAER